MSFLLELNEMILLILISVIYCLEYWLWSSDVLLPLLLLML